MPLKATKFIKKRSNIVAITEIRINSIMHYVIECYKLLLLASPTYSKSDVATKTAYHFEDYLKMEFVENYLVKNKHLLAQHISELEEVTFTYETIKRFTDTNDGMEKSDKIDIYVNKLGLKNDWSVQDEHLYLAIECKRINILSDCSSYVEDIQKFCDRNYKELRLPFESQIAIIESLKLTPINVCQEVNSRLQKTSTITTKQFLKPFAIHSSFPDSFLSIHGRNHTSKNIFKIFHLMLNYSSLVKE